MWAEPSCCRAETRRSSSRGRQASHLFFLLLFFPRFHGSVRFSIVSECLEGAEREAARCGRCCRCEPSSPSKLISFKRKRRGCPTGEVESSQIVRVPACCRLCRCRTCVCLLVLFLIVCFICFGLVVFVLSFLFFFPSVRCAPPRGSDATPQQPHLASQSRI